MVLDTYFCLCEQSLIQTHPKSIKMGMLCVNELNIGHFYDMPIYYVSVSLCVSYR